MTPSPASPGTIVTMFSVTGVMGNNYSNNYSSNDSFSSYSNTNFGNSRESQGVFKRLGGKDYGEPKV